MPDQKPLEYETPEPKGPFPWRSAVVGLLIGCALVFGFAVVLYIVRGL